MRTVDPEQHARKRAEILAAAAEEFAAHGMEGTTTARICARAGIGSGTLFHYFPTKREIFHAIFSDASAATAEVCEEALAAASPEDGVAAVAAHLTSDLDDPTMPGLAAAAMLQANADTELAAVLAAEEEQTLGALTTLLGRGARAGWQLPFPVRRTARWIVTVVDAGYLAASAADFDPRRQRSELWHLVAWLTGGAVTPPGRRARRGRGRAASACAVGS